MPQFIVTAPDGKEYEVSAPEGATHQQALEYARAQLSSAKALEEPGPKTVLKGWRDYAAGLVPGAGAIGSTLVELGNSGGTYGQPFSTLLDRIKARNASQESVVADATGADPKSLAYDAGKLTSQVAGTLGVGPALAGGAKALGAAPMIADALASGGFSAAGATGLPAWAARILGGATTGGASTALVDPENAGKGAVVGGAFPVAAKVAGEAGNAVNTVTTGAAKSLMQSAIKPTIKQLRTGEADTAVETLLKYGISPNKKGVEQIKELIRQKNTQIADEIANSTATVDPNRVVGALGDVRQRFGNQVTPASDLNAIARVADEFAATYPGAIPVQQAQQLKQGTYRVLKDKYGQLGSAETEAQKGLARGLKEEIATAVPAVGPLNAEETRLLKTLSVAERRALMELNKNPLGLAALAGNKFSLAAFMADKSAAFKALAARAINRAGGGVGLLGGVQDVPVLRGAGLLTISSDP